jgi:phage/plasmid replication protein, gene II/X family
MNNLMCDWLTVVIDCLHDPIPAGRVQVIDEDGCVTQTIVKKRSVRSSWESSIHVKTNSVRTHNGLTQGQQLFIDGNFSKFLQGHNIVGSCDIPALTAEACRVALKQLGITLYPLQLQNILNGQFVIKRCDLTASYSLPSDADVDAWIQAASVNAKTRHGLPELTHNTLYFGKHSRRWSIKFYSKSREIRSGKSKLPNELAYTPLKPYAFGKLRCEVVIRKPELERIAKRHNLVNKGSALTFDHKYKHNLKRDLDVYGYHLTPDFCQLLFNEYVERLEMNTALKLQDTDMLRLPNAVKGTYLLYRDGVDVRHMLAKPTFYRHRKILNESLGVDISLPAVGVRGNNVVPLVRVLEAKPERIPKNLLPFIFTRGNSYVTAN